MTNREFFTAILSADIADELKEFAQESIDKLDNRNKARSSKPSKTAVANEPLKASILEMMGEVTDPVTAPDIATALEITTQKASALLRQLCENGKLISTEIKVPKKGKMKSYSLVTKD